MTREETKKIVQIMAASYPNYHPSNLSDVVDAWTILLSDLSYAEVQAGLVAYIRNDVSGFAPSVGQILNMIHTIEAPQEENPLEAWDLVYKAICDSSYHAEERFNALPESVQKAVGSPSQLRQWAVNESFNLSVAQSQFIKVYNQVLEREKQISKMTPEIKLRLQQANNLGIGVKND